MISYRNRADAKNQLITRAYVVCAACICGIVFLFFFASATPVIAQTVSGSINTTPNDASSRETYRLVNNYHTSNGSIYLSANGVPLLSKSNDQALEFTLNIDGVVHPLNDSQLFRYATDTRSRIPKYEWVSDDLLVRVVFFYPTESHMQLSVIMSNTSNRPLTTGLRILFDTDFIEIIKKGRRRVGGEFFTNAATYTRETEFVPDKNTQYLGIRRDAALSTPQTPTLFFQLRGENITTPSRVVFANWTRLNQAAWQYRTIKNRDLNFPPYSEIDAGVALYYDPVVIQPQRSLIRQTVLLVDGQNTDPPLLSAYPLSIVLQAASGVDAEYLLRLLQTIEDSIIYIDELTVDDSAIPDEALDTLTENLQNVNSELQQYDRNQ